MTSLPPVSIIMTTFFPCQARIAAAEETLWSWVKNLYYDGEVHLIIADDGSPLDWEPEKIWSGRISYTYQYRQGLGASLNKGYKRAFEVSPLAASFTDDWSLTEPLDITPWCIALLENKTIGCVRLGPPHPNLTGTVEMISSQWQGWGLRLNKGGYAYGDRPALYHSRFFEDYGDFEENCSALECVRLYDEKFTELPGCDVILALPHPFWHIDSISLSDIDPNGD